MSDDRDKSNALMGTPAPESAPANYESVVQNQQQPNLPTYAQDETVPTRNLGQANPPDQQQKPGLWRSILMGALTGLAGSKGATTFGGGAAGGAGRTLAEAQQQRENAIQQQQTDSQVKFRDAQAAAMAAEVAKNDALLHALPQQQQDAHNKASLEQVTKYTEMFGNPTAVIDNTGPAAMQHMQDLTAKGGGVDHMMVINTGDKLYAWDTSSAANSDNAINFVKSAGAALGLPILENMTDDAFKKLPPAVKLQYMDTANDVHGVANLDPKNLVASMTRLQSEERTLKAKVASHPEYQSLLDNVSANLERAKGMYQQQRQDAISLKNAERVPPDGSKAADLSYRYHNTAIDRLAAPLDAATQRMDRLQATLDSGSPQADALVAPELLTIMAGGMGSGMRMNEAEIARVVGGRSKWQDLRAAIQKWSLDPKTANSITPEQRTQIRSLVGEVQNQMRSRADAIGAAREAIAGSEDPAEHKQIYANLRKQLAAGSLPSAQKTNSAPAGNGPKVGAIEDGHRFKGGDPADPKNWEMVKKGK